MIRVMWSSLIKTKYIKEQCWNLSREWREDGYSLYCPNIYTYTLSVYATSNLLVFIKGIIVAYSLLSSHGFSSVLVWLIKRGKHAIDVKTWHNNVVTSNRLIQSQRWE